MGTQRTLIHPSARGSQSYKNGKKKSRGLNRCKCIVDEASLALPLFRLLLLVFQRILLVLLRRLLLQLIPVLAL